MDKRAAQLLPRLQDPEPSERVAAVRELFEFLHEPEVVDALQALRRDPNRALRTFVDNGLTARGISANTAPRPRAAAAAVTARPIADRRPEPDLFAAIGAFAKRLVSPG